MVQCNAGMTTVFVRSLQTLPSLYATVLSVATNICLTVRLASAMTHNENGRPNGCNCRWWQHCPAVHKAQPLFCNFCYLWPIAIYACPWCAWYTSAVLYCTQHKIRAVKYGDLHGIHLELLSLPFISMSCGGKQVSDVMF